MKNLYATKHWRQLREKLLTDKEVQCHLCGKRKWIYQTRKKVWKSTSSFHLHHLTYERAGEELESDVRVLCPSCHKIFHEISKRSSSSPFILSLQAIVRQYI
jgi:5-methylcytosine-specific restriction endonuclease McrA